VSNPWLAIDVATAPLQRARELRLAWERFVAGERDPRRSLATVREPIVSSWRRSAAAGVDPSGSRIAPVVADEDETSARWEMHPLAELAPQIRACLAATADESHHLIVVSDADGLLLWLEGNARVRMRAAESMNFAEGALWSEAGAGTNAIGTALAAEHGVQVFASEHFNELVQSWTCAAAPVRDPDSGCVIGVIDLTGEMHTVHPHSMAVATATAQAVEAELRCRMLDRDNRLLARYGARLLEGAGPRALLAPSGRVLAASPYGWLAPGRLRLAPGGGELRLEERTLFVEPLGCEEAYLVRGTGSESPGERRGRTPAGEGAGAEAGAGRRPAREPAPSELLRLELLDRRRAEARIAGRRLTLRLRHSEILALLCAHPDGLTSEELSLAVYGHGGGTASIRVEVCRLRKLLGPCIEEGRYRLSCAVCSDLSTVTGLLHRGEIREAACAYRGSLLPDSRAPGVVEQRERLNAWLRQSVLVAGDLDALWAWLKTAAGAEDLLSWQRLLAALPFHDPRRSLAAASVAALRARADRAPVVAEDAPARV
jgi:hypothetical protein